MKKSIIKSIIIFIVFFISINLLGYTNHYLLGDFLLDTIPEAYNIADTFIYLPILIVVLFYIKKNNAFKDILNGEINIPDIILIIFICLLFRIVEDPIFRFKEIFYTKNEPNFISIKNNINLNTVLLFLNIVILGPFLEELVFRGLILNSFLKRNKSIGILISSVLFSLIHLSVTSFITSFFFGIVLSILFIRKGIIYSISLHVFYNLLWFVLKIFSQEYFQIEALLNFNITYWIIVIFSLSILVIYLTALYKKDYS